MNFSAWFSQITHRKPIDPGDGCQGIQPLLSLYSDNMTAPAESARVEAHLLGCEDCRRALSWMQATNAVLAHREPAMPPPDMALRIRGAIAELESGKAARPVRAPLVYRPAFAAAFTILIGAVVVAQITLRHNMAGPTSPVGGRQVAGKPSTPAPAALPSLITPPAAPAATPIHRHPDIKVAKRLPSETASEGHVGNGFVSPTVEKVKHTYEAKLRAPKPLEALREVHVITDAHSQLPQASGVKATAAPHAKHRTTPAPAAPPIRRHDDTLIANRDTTPHDAPKEPMVVPAPEPPVAPDPVRVATAETHPADVLSGVRSKVDNMRLASFVLPPSARMVRASGRSRIGVVSAASTAEYLHSESDTAPIVRQ